jgi:predicted DNA-binding ribbon-helix-helix protein
VKQENDALENDALVFRGVRRSVRMGGSFWRRGV